MRSRTGAVLVAFGLLAVAAPARASTYCVPVSGAGCANSGALSVQGALDAASSHPGPDAVRIAAGSYTGTPGDCSSDGFAYSATGSNSVTITGAGTTKTTLTCASPSFTVSELDGPATISNLSIHIPGGIGIAALYLEDGAIADGISIDSAASASNATGVIARPGTVRNTSVSLPTNDDSNGLELQDGARATDVSVTDGGTAIDTYDGGTILRAELIAPVGLWAEKGTTTIEDALIDVLPTVSSFNFGLVAQDLNSLDTGALNLAARNVTIVGSSPGSDGAFSNAAESGQTANVTLTDSIVHGPPVALDRFAVSGSTASVTTGYDDYATGAYAGSGAGKTTQNGPALNVDPDFINPAMGDFELSPGSHLIDAGTPGGLATGESATALGDEPRILAGNGGCTARRDIGAYEYAPATLPARASASSTTAGAGVPIKFHGTGCSIDPALTPNFSWRFDDGQSAAGATVSHKFKSAGTHHATLTVSDSLGRHGTTTVTVTVLPAPVLSKVNVAKHDVLAGARTRIGYVDSQAAVTTLTLSRNGHVLVRLHHHDRAGKNHLRFKAAIGGRKLKPGSYRLTIVARNHLGSRSRAVTLKLTILP
jgi:PKD repeat protein